MGSKQKPAYELRFNDLAPVWGIEKYSNRTSQEQIQLIGDTQQFWDYNRKKQRGLTFLALYNAVILVYALSQGLEMLT